MFKFLKDKLKGWLKSAEKTAEKDDRLVEAEKKKQKKQKEKEEKARKEERKREERKEIEKIVKTKEAEKKKQDERKVSGEIIEDIKREHGEEIHAIPRIEEAEEKQQKKGFFSKIFGKYSISEQEFEKMFENLEAIMLENNTALEVVDYLRDSLKKELVNKEIEKKELELEIKNALKSSLEKLFAPGFNIEDKISQKSQEQPYVIAFFGINGSGKTTSIAKLAYKLKKIGFSVVLAAADTFRAASIEQLKQHGTNLGVKVISQDYGSDPASVAYDAVEYAKSHKIQVVLIDTAGRMHTKDNLIKEMGKIVRVSKPDLKIFVGEAITGNDAIEQAKTFNEAISIDGIILSKQDVDEKGGTSLSVSYVTKKPILYLGIGQEYKDLQEFDREKLVKAIGL